MESPEHRTKWKKFGGVRGMNYSELKKKFGGALFPLKTHVAVVKPKNLYLILFYFNLFKLVISGQVTPITFF